jgi:predicted RNA-binding protein Jag
MQQKNTTSTPLTKEEFQIILNEALGNLRNETKKDSLSLREEMKKEFKEQDLKWEIRLAESEQRTDDRARQYRDEILTRMDAHAKIAEGEREERIFMENKLQDHERRITKLEHS